MFVWVGDKNLWSSCWDKGTVQLLSQSASAFPDDIVICLKHPVVYKIPLVSPWLFTILSKNMQTHLHTGEMSENYKNIHIQKETPLFVAPVTTHRGLHMAWLNDKLDWQQMHRFFFCCYPDCSLHCESASSVANKANITRLKGTGST